MRRIALTAAALLAAPTFAGCASVRPFSVASMNDVPTDYSYVAGRATQTFTGTPVTVQPAVLAALEDLRFSGVKQHNDGSALVLEGTTADDRGAGVTLKPHAGGTTRLAARIGLFGDEPLSRAFMDRVAIRLGALPPAAITIEPPSSPGSNPYFSKSAVSDAEMLKDRADAINRGADSP